MTAFVNGRGMTEPTPPERVNGLEARIAVRKADRDAATHASDLAARLAHIDIHQREARYLLERAGLLARRSRP
jgi:hypothetical protein